LDHKPYDKEVVMMANLEELQDELEKDIRLLEIDMIRLDERLNEKRRILAKLRIDGNPRGVSLPLSPKSARKSITALGQHYYEVAGKRFNNPGQILDHFNAPHYFSARTPGKGDAAAREILRWAKRNPNQARTVSVVLSNGSRVDLHMAVTKVWP
jgi:hypothetical protein